MDSRNIFKIDINFNIYQCGKIYKICSNQTEQIYIGSTTNTIEKRFNEHNHCFANYQRNKQKYMTSYDIIKYGDAYIELIENFPTDNKFDLRIRERFYIENNNCINQVIPIRTEIEKRKSKKIEKQKWYSKNKHRQIEVLRQKDKQEHKCVCGSKYRHSTKLRHTKTKRHLKYLQTPQEQLCIETKKQNFDCPCGGRYYLHNKQNHIKTTIHLNYLKNQNQQ
jgi:hypothetical protein